MKTMPYNLSIPMSKAISSSLAQSKSLSEAHNKNTVALSTGKKINESCDNSILYFKDRRLSERARGLTDVMDGLSNIISTLKSTSNAIDSLNDFLAQAKAAANSALDGRNYLSSLTGKNLVVKDSTKLSDLPDVKTGDEIIIRTGDADKTESEILMTKETTLKDLGIAKGEEYKIKIGDNDWATLKAVDENMTVTDFFGQIKEQFGIDTFTYEILDGKLTIGTTDRGAVILDGDAWSEKFGFDLSTTHKIKIDGDWTVQHFSHVLSDLDEGLSAALDKTGRLQISMIYGEDLAIADVTGKTAKSFGFAGVDDGGSHTLKSYADQYNELLRQIDSLVKDGAYNGLNLLEGDSISAIFDEKGSTMRTVKGEKLDSESLGLPTATDGWENRDDIQNAFDAVQQAVYKLNKTAARFDRALAMVSSRESYLEALSDTCQTGAETLTGADLNEVSAQLLAIRTQTELVNNVISITLEAESSVLSLF